MPATEETARSTKQLHMLFGISSLIMLLTTLWMFAADHRREWKDYQRQFFKVEAQFAEYRITEERSGAFEDRARELKDVLEQARGTVPNAEMIDGFLVAAEAPDPNAESRTFAEANGYNVARVETSYERLASLADGALSERQAARERLVEAMDKILSKARFEEFRLASELKNRRGELDDVRSKYALGVEADDPPSTLSRLAQRVEEQQAAVDALVLEQQAAKRHVDELSEAERQIAAVVADAAKALEEHERGLSQLQVALADRELTTAKKTLTLPILDAFMSPLKPDQIWLPKLTLNNNFRDVARFDRCATCHQGIDQTAPGSAVDPKYPAETFVSLALATPKEAPSPASDVAGNSLRVTTEQVYGLTLAEEGLLEADDVTVAVVLPRSAAALAQLRMGDVIVRIGEVSIRNRTMAQRYLLESVEWGTPLDVTVRRGMPHPIASHPRLDLFVGSLSPHKKQEMGCTICHDGQGSATEFKWASHTPNGVLEAHDWSDEYGWFNNHHWIFPMYPERFTQSTCLKCHHDVTELEPSEQFPDPPAEELVRGYETVRRYGCFGCHEINGYDGPDKRRGPDLRVEPTYHAAAARLLIDDALTDEERSLANHVVAHPDDTQARHKLGESLKAGASPAEEGEAPRITGEAVKLADMLAADNATPGQLRKVGPSLRYVGSKLDREFLYSWIADPTDFRPSTRMPKFFGLWDHLLPEPVLDEQGQPVLDEEGHPVTRETVALEDAQRFEPIEIRGIVEYLLANSEPFEYLPYFDGVTERPSAERGKQLFQVRGCLACHQHKDFPEATADQGPDLSRVSAKLRTPNGEKWLYSWVREPNRYHARTVMPNLFLEPITHDDGTVTDPADDITAYLVTSQADWQPAALPAVDEDSLDDLVQMHLEGVFSRRQAAEYATNGVPPSLRDSLKGDEVLMVRDGDVTAQQKLLYVGRRSLGKGCAGCHDIPGFEDAKPIGTGLADWGRKEPSKLAFEQIVNYLEVQRAQHDPHGSDAAHGHAGLDPMKINDENPDEAFFIDAILNHERMGFLWQKLRDPRSYDYKKTEQKPYLDRLRMPKFNFTEEDIEAAMTFVLGLVADPPAAEYVYEPSPRRKAVLDGQRLVRQFNCDGCHTLKMETWEFEYDPDEFGDPPPFNDYAFLEPYFTAKELEASREVDRRGMGHATLVGRPNPQKLEDDDGELTINLFGLWQPVAINGHAWPVGGVEIPIPESQIISKRPEIGGTFARMLHPIALAHEQTRPGGNPNAKETDAWGWVPPPLVGEGLKVKTDWLHDFLLEPYAIRPAVVLRMPKFNMSSSDARKLADYFAAVDDVEYPYEFNPRTTDDYLAAMEQQHAGRLDDALKIVTDNDYCIKCHRLGDYSPLGSVAALAPNLDQVSSRLRPEFLKRWLANPQRTLPYTGMPVNFPQDKPARPELFDGTSLQQLQAVVDLLSNYGRYMNAKTSFKSQIKPPPPAAETSASTN